MPVTEKPSKIIMDIATKHNTGQHSNASFPPDCCILQAVLDYLDNTR